MLSGDFYEKSGCAVIQSGRSAAHEFPFDQLADQLGDFLGDFSKPLWIHARIIWVVAPA
jgi:hypothetical protein